MPERGGDEVVEAGPDDTEEANPPEESLRLDQAGSYVNDTCFQRSGSENIWK